MDPCNLGDGQRQCQKIRPFWAWNAQRIDKEAVVKALSFPEMALRTPDIVASFYVD
jgi:hypothetical protein